MEIVYKVDSLEEKTTDELQRERALTDFLRYSDTEDKETYFRHYGPELVESVKRDWAKIAYSIMVKSIKGEELTDSEKDYKEAYINYLTTNTELTGAEHDMMSFYIMHRLTKDYKPNDIVLSPAIEHSYDEGLDEFAKTLGYMLRETLGETYEVHFDELPNRGLVYKHGKLGARNVLTIDSGRAAIYYTDFVRNNNPEALFTILRDCYLTVGMTHLKSKRKHELSPEAVIYDLEESFEKRGKKTPLFAEIAQMIVANKLIYVDACKECEDTLANLTERFAKATYGEVNEDLKKYVDQVHENTASLEHLKDPASLPLLYAIYNRGLRATPKTNVSKSTPYIVVGGDRLTLFEIDSLVSELAAKAAACKDEERQELLEKKWADVKRIRDFAYENDDSHKLEELIDKNGVTEETVKYALAHREAFNELLYRLKRSFYKLNDLAGCNQASKVSTILDKEIYLKKMLGACKMIDFRSEHTLTTPNYEHDVVIEAYNMKHVSALVAFLQGVTGKGVIEIKDKLNTGEFVIYDVDERTRETLVKTLQSKGAVIGTGTRKPEQLKLF